MDDINFKVEGLSELNDKLVEAGAKAGVKVLRKAGRKAMKPVAESMRNNAKEDTGDLKLSIGMRAKTGGRKSKTRVMTISVGPLRKKVKGRKLRNINQKAVAQEFGNKKGVAKPFIRKALDVHKEDVLTALKRELANELDKLNV